MYWLVRKWEETKRTRTLQSWEVVGIFQMEKIETGLVGKYQIGRVVKSNSYAVWDIKYIPKAIIEPITEAEYQTYLAFGVFPEPLDFPNLKV